MKHRVGKSGDGKRLDVYLVGVTGKSRQTVKGWLDSGAVRLNGRRVAIAKWAMREGDTVEVRLAAGHRERERSAARQMIEILHEDRDVIVINKSAGVKVTLEKGSSPFTVVDQVRTYLRRRHPGSGGTYVKPVHRLDADTSGVMVLAKSKAGEKVIAQFKSHAIRRQYLAIVEGRIEAEEGKIELPLVKGDFPFGKKVAVSDEGKAAVTGFRVEERYEEATFVELTPETGRTHQIRAHLAAIGHPIIGDPIYGRADPNRIKRHALHAAYLAFKHPVTGKRIEAKSPLPNDMAALIDQLRGE